MKILIAESRGFSPAALQTLRGVAEVVEADLDRAGLLSACGDIDILWVRLRNQIDAEVFDAAPQLKVVVTPTTGLNHIDQQEAARRGIRIVSLKGEVAFLKDVRATAELTVGLMLMLMRNLLPAATDSLRGNWNRDAFQGHELYGKTVGIIGYGRLGHIVARYLQAFDMRVLVTDPDLDSEELGPGLTRVPLAKLLRDSDIVSLHVNLCDDTYGFFGSNEFDAMQPGAWFINTARGELVDEQALLNALRSGRLAGAALDVLCDEQSTGMGHNELVEYAKTHPQLIITPHIGGCTHESMEKTERFLAGRLVAKLAAGATS
ncbi:MAG TPA: NAD(P)-dependent oxidoreductase [Pirellulales bacterium]|nr:NAD(P)-dependent oxidoreductase [Pirellulales bacterium]